MDEVQKFKEKTLQQLDETNTALTQNKKRVTDLNKIFGLVLLIWPFCLGGSAMMFDDPKSLTNPDPGTVNTFHSIAIYPITYLISLIGSRYLLGKNFGKAAFVFALLPIIIIIVMGITPFIIPMIKIFGI